MTNISIKRVTFDLPSYASSDDESFCSEELNPDDEEEITFIDEDSLEDDSIPLPFSSCNDTKETKNTLIYNNIHLKTNDLKPILKQSCKLDEEFINDIINNVINNSIDPTLINTKINANRSKFEFTEQIVTTTENNNTIPNTETQSEIDSKLVLISKEHETIDVISVDKESDVSKLSIEIKSNSDTCDGTPIEDLIQISSPQIISCDLTTFKDFDLSSKPDIIEIDAVITDAVIDSFNPTKVISDIPKHSTQTDTLNPDSESINKESIVFMDQSQYVIDQVTVTGNENNTEANELETNINPKHFKLSANAINISRRPPEILTTILNTKIPELTNSDYLPVVNCDQDIVDEHKIDIDDQHSIPKVEHIINNDIEIVTIESLENKSNTSDKPDLKNIIENTGILDKPDESLITTKQYRTTETIKNTNNKIIHENIKTKDPLKEERRQARRAARELRRKQLENTQNLNTTTPSETIPVKLKRKHSRSDKMSVPSPPTITETPPSPKKFTRRAVNIIEEDNLNCAGELETLGRNQRDILKEKDILIWIYNMIDEPARVDFEFFLKDGCILCKLMNKIKPGCIPEDEITWEGAKSKQRNITNFLKHAESYGVPKSKLFFPEDILHLRHIPRVTRCIFALAKLTQDDPSLGAECPQLGDEPSFLQDQPKKIFVPGHRDTKDVLAQLTATKDDDAKDKKDKKGKHSLYK